MMADDKPKSPWEGGDGAKALETLAAASAVGITIATQAMGFWLSVLSGATSNLRGDQAEPPVKKAPEAPKPQAKPEAKEPRPSAEIVELKPKAAPVQATPERVAEAPAPEAKPVVEMPKPVVAAPVVAPPVEVKPAVEPVAPAKVVAAPAATPAKAKAAKPVKAKPASVVAKPAQKPAVPKAASAMRQPKAMDKPDQPDDLKQINGLGPKLESALNGLGIWTFAQIAALEPAEIAWLDDTLGLSGRIARDGWIDAAQAGGKHG